MVCSLHSVTTGSRDRANVSLIIIIIVPVLIILNIMGDDTRGEQTYSNRLSVDMIRLTWDGTAEPVSRDKILRWEHREGKNIFSCSTGHEQI